MTTQHTPPPLPDGVTSPLAPLPWRIEYTPRRGLQIESVSHNVRVCERISTDTNAQLIVTACNAHDELVAALRKIEMVAANITEAQNALAHAMAAAARAALAKVTKP